MPNTWGDATDWGLRRIVIWIVGGASVVLAISSVCISLRSQYWYPRLYGFWIIGPPIWFFFEYHFIFNRKDDDAARDQLKMAQDVAQKFWAALLVLLAGIGYFQWHLSLSAK